MAEKNVKSRVDWFLLTVILGIMSLGYVMMVSSSLHLGEKIAGNSFHYPMRQLMHIALSFVLVSGVVLIPMRFWERYGSIFFIFGLFLLVLVLVPGFGIKVNGSTRWLSILGLRIQVSELMKFCSVIYISGYVVRHQETVENKDFGLIKPLMLFSLACVLLLLEPDFGSSVVLLTIAMSVMYLAGARLWQFVILIAVVLVLGRELIYSSDYRLARITSFVDPWADPQNTGFQLIQALIAFGRGEYFGVGLGNSVQKMFYLPEGHTDFLFSIIAEELGLIGVLSVIILYTLLIFRAFSIGTQAEKLDLRFSAFVAYGMGVWFAFQSFINIGVNMGILPTKGLTLPLMSYGGGSMIVMSIALSLLFRIHYEVVTTTTQKSKRNKKWEDG
ncbi:MAG: putative lipid II flippase FtsW [Methylococcales bacterium]|nr:putative lipid II flippase FtsW [Methylococcales bacterium]